MPALQNQMINFNKVGQCAAIGEGNLIMSCLQMLLDHGFGVTAVFSNTECVKVFCEQKNIPIWPQRADMEDTLKNHSIDYIFSILNPRVLKGPVLKLAKKMCINYHDSPLPAYAGVHATSWAIINGEKMHGISWHVMEIGIDTGDILQFKPITVDPDDSAFTLNMKCHEAAKETFQKLVKEICTDSLEPKKQVSNNSSYFGLNDIPPNLGILDFHLSSSSVYNLGRALEFGNFENSLGSPKITTSNQSFLLVTNIEKSTCTANEMRKPGSIIDIVDDTLVVAADDSNLLLAIANLDGSPVTKSEFKTYEISIGKMIGIDVNIDTKPLISIRKKESFWRKKLAVYEPTVFFRQRMNVVATVTDVSTNFNLKSLVIKLPSVGTHLKHSNIHDFLLPSFVAFMARIICESDICLGLMADKSQISPNIQNLYSDICPGVFNVLLENNIYQEIKNLYDILCKYRDSKTFLVDMFYRYPELRGQKRIPHHNIVLGMVHTYDKEMTIAHSVLHDCNILLLFNDTGSEMHLLYNERPGKEKDYMHIADVLKHFPTFLSEIDNGNGSRSLLDISLVNEIELDLLFGIPKVIDVVEKNIFIDFKFQCKKSPQNIALKSTTNSLTYQEVLTLVDQVSNSLNMVNHEETILALHLPNSLAYIICILAVLKTGRAYLPLPMDYPEDRKKFTMCDAHVHSMLTTRNAFESYINIHDKSVKPSVITSFCVAGLDVLLVSFPTVQEDIPTISNEQNGKKPNLNRQEVDISADICYVMYTSGSTGRPKGVKVTHAGVRNLAYAQIKKWDLRDSDTIAQFASIGFDATTSEIFTALLSGATLAVLGEKERLGNEFVHAMNALGANVITLAPSALNIYGPKDLPKLTKVVTAGEACCLSTALKWTMGQNSIKFFNAYGPTETTVCASIYEFISTEDHEDMHEDLPIGKAINGACVYLFDKFLKPVPPDIVGEIYIGGAGVSRGYLGHASHYNTQRFIQNPLTDKPMLLYKTGDHAFQDNNGNLTFVGRLDDMVKVRGQRVDLSEIEQVIIQHTKIELAVVVVHKCTMSRDVSISAFIAPSFVYLSEFREYLSRVLPKYMIPTFIKKMEISDFPMTINGKIDRKALEKDESVHEKMHTKGSSHLNFVQLTIGKLWCKILKLDETAIYNFHRQTSFSELGGNSLQLVLLQRLLEEKLMVHLSFTDIGTADTIEDLSEVVRRKKDMLLKKVTISPNVDDLRRKILNDAFLDPSTLPSTARRGSVQFNHFAAFTQKCTFKYPRNVLISGVTGFLGAYLLQQLLNQTNAHVCCMVRESTEARGLGRVIDNMRRYNLWKSEYASRIAIVISDLSQEHLGIAPDIYNALCTSVDAVFMNAAMMNFNAGYETHMVANVESTKEFIKFALTGTQKYLFTTSSLGVLLFPRKQNQIFYENDFFDDPCEIESGYGQSKWASENLVMQALDYLPGGAIFRPARISGCSRDGIGPMNDLFSSTIIGMTKLGSYPDMNFPYDLTPVDFVAQAMIEIAVCICNENAEHKRVFHLFNQQTIPFKDLFTDMHLGALELGEWRNALKNAPEDNKELIPLTPFFMSDFWDRSPMWPIFDTRNTNKYISDETKALLKPTWELLPLYKQYFGVK